MRPPPVAAAVVLVAGLAVASCGGSTPLGHQSARQILARVASAVTHTSGAPAVEVQVATPTTTLTQYEDPQGDVSGTLVTPDGTVEAVRTATGVLSLAFSARFVERTAPASVRADAAALRIAADAMNARWWNGAGFQVDPAATHLASIAFADSPRIDEEALFSPTGATVSVGPATTFDGTKVVPLTVRDTGDVLFVGGTSALPVGASVSNGADTSPTIYTFQWTVPSTVAPIFTTPTSASLCGLWHAAAGVRPLLTSLAAAGTYARC